VNNTYNPFPRIVLFVLQLLLMGFLLVPLNVLPFPWWADALILLATLIFPVLGGFLFCAVWIWSFILIVQMPYTTYTTIYIVTFIVYVFLFCVRQKASKK